MIFLVHYNHDYNESMAAHGDLRAALEDIRATFDVEAEIIDADFDEEVTLSYQNDDWKGLTLHALNPENRRLVEIAIREASAALRSSHAELSFLGRLRSKLGAAPGPAMPRPAAGGQA